ncbi:DUF5615 family PIN-like protein [Candidatus Margulisiibacteriota bacterium]
MRFLANENFPLTSIKILRKKGFAIKSISEESPGITDAEVLKRACKESLIILTYDRDYGQLIYKYNLFKPKGVIYLRPACSYPEEAAETLLVVFNKIKPVLANKFVIIDKRDETINIRQRKI